MDAIYHRTHLGDALLHALQSLCVAGELEGTEARKILADFNEVMAEELRIPPVPGAPVTRLTVNVAKARFGPKKGVVTGYNFADMPRNPASSVWTGQGGPTWFIYLEDAAVIMGGQAFPLPGTTQLGVRRRICPNPPAPWASLGKAKKQDWGRARARGTTPAGKTKTQSKSCKPEEDGAESASVAGSARVDESKEEEEEEEEEGQGAASGARDHRRIASQTTHPQQGLGNEEGEGEAVAEAAGRKKVGKRKRPPTPEVFRRQGQRAAGKRLVGEGKQAARAGGATRRGAVRARVGGGNGMSDRGRGRVPPGGETNIKSTSTVVDDNNEGDSSSSSSSSSSSEDSSDGGLSAFPSESDGDLDDMTKELEDIDDDNGDLDSLPDHLDELDADDGVAQTSSGSRRQNRHVSMKPRPDGGERKADEHRKEREMSEESDASSSSLSSSSSSSSSSSIAAAALEFEKFMGDLGSAVGGNGGGSRRANMKNGKGLTRAAEGRSAGDVAAAEDEGDDVSDDDGAVGQEASPRPFPRKPAAVGHKQYACGANADAAIEAAEKYRLTQGNILEPADEGGEIGGVDSELERDFEDVLEEEDAESGDQERGHGLGPQGGGDARRSPSPNDTGSSSSSSSTGGSDDEQAIKVFEDFVKGIKDGRGGEKTGQNDGEKGRGRDVPCESSSDTSDRSRGISGGEPADQEVPVVEDYFNDAAGRRGVATGVLEGGERDGQGGLVGKGGGARDSEGGGDEKGEGKGEGGEAPEGEDSRQRSLSGPYLSDTKGAGSSGGGDSDRAPGREHGMQEVEAFLNQGGGMEHKGRRESEGCKEKAGEDVLDSSRSSSWEGSASSDEDSGDAEAIKGFEDFVAQF